jgi:2,3-bisphosphoglycerate-independent phosphoglycerate mutase
MANLVLIILDGFGYNPKQAYNAIAHAQTPQWDHWWETCPHLLLEASGSAVGLPKRQMGNSEVGHMHIGAGRPIPQDLTRINHAIKTGEFFHNPIFLKMLQNLKNNGKALHVMGLLSPGGVHSHEGHLFAFLDLCAQNNFHKVYCHLFLDGRDSPPRSALKSIVQLKKYPQIKLCSLSGRYYAMDRDNRLERTDRLMEMLTHPKVAASFRTAQEMIETYYAQNIDDEFMPPSRLSPGPSIEEGDAVFCFNFRADRVRQLAHAIQAKFKLSDFVTMTQYANHLKTSVVFPPSFPSNTLGEVIAAQGMKQLRIAETEKYAHVTFFFNGGREEPFPLEDRILIPSPKVATYDLQPEMNAPLLTQTLIEAIQQKKYDLIICNYANADMVGHSGNFQATVRAIEALDTAMQQISVAIQDHGGQLLITADHGNAESMYDPETKQDHTAHTTSPVPFLYVGNQWTKGAEKGQLIDIAPTLLQLLGIQKPSEMTGQSLLVKKL